jgi:DNA helicase-2/ATP-dependent DNA helicase PcrA
MSSSKQSKSSIKSSISDFNGEAFFNNIVPSKIFNVSDNDKYPLVQSELNCKIAKLTNPVSLNYTTKIANVMSVLRDKEIVEYQQSLMKAAIDNISEDSVDIDYIRIGLSLTSTDIDKLLDSENGLVKVRTKDRRKRLTVNKMPNVGNKNNGFKTGDKKPYYTIGFRMFADNDDYRYINIFIAEHYNECNDGRVLKYNCSIEFIPTRLSLPLISFMLYQIQSVLEIRRYQQLFDNALLLELHTGYIMYGVSQLFGFMLTINNMVKVGPIYPQEKDMATETAYVGSYASDHLIGYDKVLKENKMFIEDAVLGWDRVAKGLSGINDWFPNQVCSYRLESRRRFEKEPVYLVDISSVKSLLEDVRLIRPQRLFDLNDIELKALIIDKSLKNCRNAQALLEGKNNERREAGKKSKYLSFRFTRKKVEKAISSQADLLLEAIRNPVKGLTETKKNYSAAVASTAEALVQIIKDICSKSHKVPTIIKAEERAIYVEGCPGSGKTTLVVGRVEHLLTQGTKASEICVLAFTNEAAKAFNNVLAKSFTKRSNDLKLYSKDMFVGTFSSWCNKLLKLDDDQKILNAQASLKVIERLIPYKSMLAKQYLCDDIARRCQNIFNHMANFDEPIVERSINKVAPDLVDYVDEISELLNAYNKYKKGRYRDFNDLLVQLRECLKNDDFCEWVLTQTKHLIIDEIQDTNIIQWDIIKKLYDHGIHFFCVGDPAQSMYGFRGAKHEYLDKFKNTFTNNKRFQLSKNRRSTEPLVTLANQIRYIINPKYSISVSVKEPESTARPRLKSCDKLQDATKWLVNDIKIRQSSESQLILCRYNKQVETVEKALTAAHIEHGEGKAIKVLTYHKGKGLEAEHCYVLDPQFSKSKLSSYREELCNAYVALTRAKQALTILACNTGSSMYGLDNNEKHSGKSIFLALPEKLLEIVD